MNRQELAGQVSAELAGICQGLSEAERLIAGHRLSRHGAKRTLEQIGKELGVTRERIRQIETRLVKKLAHAVGASVQDIGAQLKEELEPVIEQNEFDARVSRLFAFPDGLPEAIANAMLREELKYRCVHKICLDEAAQSVCKKLAQAVADNEDDVGLAKLADLYLFLPDVKWHSYVPKLITACAFHTLDDMWVSTKKITKKARVKESLRAIGKPATRQQISAKLKELFGLNISRLDPHFANTPSIVRTDQFCWGLSEWTEQEYKGISEAIEHRIIEGGGRTSLQGLLEELPRKFKVKQGSVRAYVDTPRFVLENGEVSLRKHFFPSLRPLDEVADGRDESGAPYWVFKAHNELLRGSGLINVPPEIADQLGCAPNSSVRVKILDPKRCRDLSVNWTLASIGRVTLGYLSDPIRKLKASHGQRVRLIMCSKDAVAFQLDHGGGENKTNEPEQHSALANRPRLLTAGCLFSGMGGFATGLKNAGFKILWASDNDDYACEVFRHRFPETRVLQNDISDLTVAESKLDPVDVLIAGFPCQSFSQAGSRTGFGDNRGGAFSEIPRLLKEFDEQERPRFVVLENVAHLLWGEDGAWFDRVQRELRGAGYWFRKETCWRANVKDFTDIPQDRERVFLVAASRAHFPRNPFIPPAAGHANTQKSLADIVDRSSKAEESEYLPPENQYAKMIMAEMSDAESDQNIFQLRRSYVREKRGGLCPTLTANMGTGGHNVPFIRDQWGIRRLSVEEVAYLQGFDTGEKIFPSIPQTEQYRLLGNAVCPKLANIVGIACAKILKDRG